MWIIRDREAGNEIARVESYRQAADMVAMFEAEDEKDDIYEDDFYEIVEVVNYV